MAANVRLNAVRFTSWEMAFIMNYFELKHNAVWMLIASNTGKCKDKSNLTQIFKAAQYKVNFALFY